MPNDPISAALRRDAALLLDLAPVPNAAAWHAVRAARARRLSWIMSLCGWGLRALLLVAAIGLVLLAPSLLLGAAVPLALVGWLSSGMCAPLVSRREGPRTVR